MIILNKSLCSLFKKINKKFLLERVINKVSQSNRISRIIKEKIY